MTLIRAAITAGRRVPLKPPRAAGARFLGSSSTPEEWQAAGYEVSPKNGAPKIYSPWNKWFPYEPVPFSPRLGPYIEKLEKGQEYYWCSCGESITQPFCDNVGCEDTKFEPVLYVPPYDEKVWFCGSKHSPSRPLFNGTCWTVWIDVNPFLAAAGGFGACFIFGLVATWFIHP